MLASVAAELSDFAFASMRMQVLRTDVNPSNRASVTLSHARTHARCAIAALQQTRKCSAVVPRYATGHPVLFTWRCEVMQQAMASTLTAVATPEVAAGRLQVRLSSESLIAGFEVNELTVHVASSQMERSREGQQSRDKYADHHAVDNDMPLGAISCDDLISSAW